jgi:hypothetical protein
VKCLFKDPGRQFWQAWVQITSLAAVFAALYLDAIMEESQSPPTEQAHYEVEIQEAEKEIASLQLELDAVLDEGARDIVYKLRKIIAALKRDLHPQEQQRLLAEREILWNDPLFLKYFTVSSRKVDAEIRLRKNTARLRRITAQEPPPVAPLQEIPVLETVAVVGDGKNAESKSKSLPSVSLL